MIRLESQHTLPFPREAVWPVLSKTDWLNRALGLPPVEYHFAAKSEGGSAVTARARMAGIEMRWREHPFEWLEPEFYRVHRIYEKGPFKEAAAGMELRDEPGGGTRVIVSADIEPRHAFGSFLARAVLGPKTARDMRKIMAHVASFLSGETTTILPDLNVHPVHESALQSGMQKLRGSGLAEELIERVEAMLRDSADVELTHIRPFALARTWGSDPWEILALFLHSTRSGLLDFSWEVLCPECRSTRMPLTSSLSALKRTSHCDVCQIGFDAQFDKSVELKFAVNPSIRPREEQTFCLAGPAGKAHVLSQLWLQPGEERLWKLPPLLRPLRLRSPQIVRSLNLDSDDKPTATERLVITCDPTQLLIAREPAPAEDSRARIVNPNAFPLLLSIEQIAWSDDILTAGRVTNWQEFRDLFASEVISPREEVTVGFQVVLFTDLCGSTAIYHGMGDAPAYALVRDHFIVLAEAIGTHHGAVVKTIGDAVMGTFSRVDEALAAVREIHRRLPEANLSLGPQALKASLHVGPCLAVNANDRLDFFGTTINLAARMVDHCRGGDLTVSDEFFHRPEMSDFLRGYPLAPESSEVQFRGFKSPHRVWRIEMGALAQEDSAT